MPLSRSQEVPQAAEARWYGVYPAVVTDNLDPETSGRILVTLPWAAAGGEPVTAWARVATLMAGQGHGSWFMPDIGSEVLLAFEGGNPRKPYVAGALWNGKETPPEKMDGGKKNPLKVLHSRNGIRIAINDAEEGASLTLETPAQRIVLNDNGAAITIRDAGGNTITLGPAGIEIQSASKISLNASTVEINGGTVTVNAAMARFSGVVQTETLIANAVVANSYTPGAGNVW